MDARAQRSRDRLFAAVLALVAETPVEQLSVTEVARRADVHRSTFYEYASTPDGLLRAALLAELDGLRADLLHDPGRGTDAAVVETTRQVLEHVLRHLEVYRRGLADDAGAGGLHAMLGEHFLGSSRQLLGEGRLSLPTDVPGADLDVVADAALRLIALGTVGVIRSWIALPDPDEATFAAIYGRLVPDWWSQLDR